MPKYNKARKTWFYANEFKIKAVKLSCQPDIQSKQVDDLLGPAIYNAHYRHD